MGLSSLEQFRIVLHGALNIYISVTKAKKMIILKLEFEKAFDKIEHKAMIEIMKAKGFGERWISWMEFIFNSGTSPSSFCLSC
jgi:hypothetical protein